MENKIRGAFDEVRAGEQLKASAAQYLKQQRAKGRRWETPRRSSGWVRGLAALCAVAVLVLAGGVWQGMVRTPVSYVSVDVNPSAELALNRFDRVVSATAYNEDGAAVLTGLELEGKPYTEAVEALLSSEAMAAYRTADAELVLTVAADADRQARLLEGVGACAGRLDYNGVCYGADASYVAAAHSCGMSLGKYAAWQTLLQYGQPLTEEECHDMTMDELHDRIHACEDGGVHHGDETLIGDGLISGEPAAQSAAPVQSAAPSPSAAPSQSAEPVQSAAPSQSAGGHHSHGHHESGHE